VRISDEIDTTASTLISVSFQLQLGFNKDCDSVQVAIEFCSKHSLGDEYIEQITSFVDMYKQAL
jgi:hypothetical protein